MIRKLHYSMGHTLVCFVLNNPGMNVFFFFGGGGGVDREWIGVRDVQIAWKTVTLIGLNGSGQSTKPEVRPYNTTEPEVSVNNVNSNAFNNANVKMNVKHFEALKSK